jgi:magnesium chelatase subunit D
VSADAARAVALLAVDPVGLGGAVLRASPGPWRDAWLAALRTALPAGTPWRRLPLNAPDSRLLGGLDLAATLAAGRPIAERGVLAEADGGVVLLPMAERIESHTAAKLAAVLDQQMVSVQRDGLSLTLPTRLAMVALDEGLPEEATPLPLRERLAFLLTLDTPCALGPEPVAAARARLPHVAVPDALVEALCGAALALGIWSLRPPLMALRAARASAALAGRDLADNNDAALAARLVLGPRATRLPEQQEPEPPPPEPPPPDEAPPDDTPQAAPDAGQLQDLILEAARATMPAGVLAALGAEAREAARRSATTAGRAGELRRSVNRGRPIGTRPGVLRGAARLALVDTLRAAAPWQRLRRAAKPGAKGPLIHVQRDDIRVKRFQQHTETTAIFAVDASGSAALNRLAEAKGAVELLLADCYVRRDQVAVVAFRGSAAEILLPPTNSLVRAKRSLAGLPGGGATPLASGIDAALTLAEEQRRRGRTPLVVLLTDGRANIARDGAQGRPRAEADAMAAGAALRLSGVPALLVDTAPRATAFGRALAQAMGARYLPLPSADSQRLSAAVAETRTG